ncbi:MAG: DUF167 domain-containing protein [Candidatus Bathyarchaeia archaeon]
MRIIVEVKTSSREERVKDLGEGLYSVWVKAPRKKGKANAAVLKLLRDHFGRQAVIVSGHTSARKIIELEEEF